MSPKVAVSSAVSNEITSSGWSCFEVSQFFFILEMIHMVTSPDRLLGQQMRELLTPKVGGWMRLDGNVGHPRSLNGLSLTEMCAAGEQVAHLMGRLLISEHDSTPVLRSCVFYEHVSLWMT